VGWNNHRHGPLPDGFADDRPLDAAAAAFTPAHHVPGHQSYGSGGDRDPRSSTYWAAQQQQQAWQPHWDAQGFAPATAYQPIFAPSTPASGGGTLPGFMPTPSFASTASGAWPTPSPQQQHWQQQQQQQWAWQAAQAMPNWRAQQQQPTPDTVATTSHAEELARSRAEAAEARAEAAERAAQQRVAEAEARAREAELRATIAELQAKGECGKCSDDEDEEEEDDEADSGSSKQTIKPLPSSTISTLKQVPGADLQKDQITNFLTRFVRTSGNHHALEVAHLQ
jgi:hypothetical protein